MKENASKYARIVNYIYILSYAGTPSSPASPSALFPRTAQNARKKRGRKHTDRRSQHMCLRISESRQPRQKADRKAAARSGLLLFLYGLYTPACCFTNQKTPLSCCARSRIREYFLCAACQVWLFREHFSASIASTTISAQRASLRGNKHIARGHTVPFHRFFPFVSATLAYQAALSLGVRLPVA